MGNISVILPQAYHWTTIQGTGNLYFFLLNIQEQEMSHSDAVKGEDLEFFSDMARK